MKKRKTKKNILKLVILTTITVFSWIAFDIYHTFRKSTIPQVLQKQLEPLDPNFDKKTLESLQKRRIITLEELDSAPEMTQFEPTEEIASPSAKASNTESTEVTESTEESENTER